MRFSGVEFGFENCKRRKRIPAAPESALKGHVVYDPRLTHPKRPRPYKSRAREADPDRVIVVLVLFVVGVVCAMALS